jgi:hypothetical protein
LERVKRIIEILAEAENYLLKATATKDPDERIRLENEAERCLELARKLELELD